MAKKKQEIEKHPVTIAWEQWLASKQGISALNTHTLGYENPTKYLRNRLECAFIAGRDYGESKPKP